MKTIGILLETLKLLKQDSLCRDQVIELMNYLTLILRAI